MVKINSNTYDKIVIDRKNGATYKQICQKYGVSKWWCIEHLKNTKPEKTYYEERWKIIQDRSEGYLKENGFNNIVDLNKISQNGYWDYLCFKGNDRWLIDVTINGTKSSIKKGLQVIDGFRCGVLYYADNKFNLLEIKLNELGEN